MMQKTNFLWVLLAAVALGCPNRPDDELPTSDDSPAVGAAETDAATPAAHGHSHADGDALTWLQKEVDHAGYLISLGLHGPHLHAGEEAEPAIMVTKAGEAVPSAKVFVTLLDDTGEEVIVEETATVFEPKTVEEPAHYAQGMLAIPADARRVTVRYRIALEGTDEFVHNELMATK